MALAAQRTTALAWPTRATAFCLSVPRALWSDYGKNCLFPREEPIVSVDAIPDSVGHHLEWIHAIKDSAAPDVTTCNFGYSGRLAETIFSAVAPLW